MTEVDAEDIESMHIAWEGTAGSQIFLMQLGFLCYEVGFVNPIWTASIVIKNLEDTFVGILAFISLSYTLSVGSPDFYNVIGSLDHIFLIGIHEKNHSDVFIRACYATTCCTIISGAVLERMKNKGYIMWCLLIIVVNYSFISFWCWDREGWLYKLGYMDCAGGVVVHMTGGIAGVMSIYFLGPRSGSIDPRTRMLKDVDAPHRPIMVAMGVFILWYGWFAFNITSPFVTGVDIGDKLSSIPLTTIISPTASSFVCFFLMRYYYKKVSFEHLVGCVLSGLVATTASTFTVHVWVSFVVGMAAAPTYFVTFWFIRHKMQIDDPLGIGAIHMACGFLGGILEGIFADDTVGHPGLVYGGYKHFLVQTGGTILCAFVNFVVCYFLWTVGMKKVLFKRTQLRVTALDTYLGTKLFHLTPAEAFQDLLVCKTNMGRQVLLHFHNYLAERMCDEQLDFLCACSVLRDFKYIPGNEKTDSEVLTRVVSGISHIVDTYLQTDSIKCVNVSDYARALPIRVRDAAWTESRQHLLLNMADRSVFDASYNEVFKMLMEPLRRFLASFDRKGKTVSYRVKVPFKILPTWVLVWDNEPSHFDRSQISGISMVEFEEDTKFVENANPMTAEMAQRKPELVKAHSESASSTSGRESADETALRMRMEEAKQALEQRREMYRSNSMSHSVKEPPSHS